jgi:hypothetical protein
MNSIIDQTDKLYDEDRLVYTEQLTYNDDIFPNVDVRVDDGSVDDWSFTDKNVIANLKREEGHAKEENDFSWKLS